MGNVFISYSSKDGEWVKNWLLPKLEGAGLKVHIDFRDFEIGIPSLINMERAVELCEKTLLVLTPNWLNSEWTNFEALMVQSEDPIGLRNSIIPLMLEKCDLPKRLSIFTYANFKDKNNRDTELARLLKQLGCEDSSTHTVTSPSADTKPKISLSRMPVTGKKLFGRDKELRSLNKAWNNGKLNVITLTAWGGVGKTSLVNKWLNRMAKKNFKGAEKVYAWSFYSQGAAEGKQASADEFMLETLKWFGDANPPEGSAVDRGRQMANLVKKERCLLILDGMEPLQYPPGEGHGLDGQLKDPGLKAMLKELAISQPGLCIITTREPVTDLKNRMGSTVKEMLLEDLSREAGLTLLREMGVKGLKKELLEAVEEYGGHALALTLLGNYLRVVFGGDIRKRDRVPALNKDHEQGAHARRVMKAYEIWLKDKPELDILRMMGLFDRPVEAGAIATLKEEPAIPGVTEQLQSLSEVDWQYALDHLRKLRLLAAESSEANTRLDCHPLVREHFAEQLETGNREGWQAANLRLYNYYKALPEIELPDTLEEMEPLFAAITHGCRAGLHQEVMDEVYEKRVIRGGREDYTGSKLGAFGADLAALSHFFETPWSRPAAGLREVFKSAVLSWAAFRLRALGRLIEALQPMQKTLEMMVKQEHWGNAAIAAGNMSELMLTLGRVPEAVQYSEQAVVHADRSEDAFQKGSKRTAHADALHQAGHMEEAERLFREAETLQKENQPEFPFLYSLSGYQFCDLLLGQGEYRQVLERAVETIKIAKENNHLISIALDTLSLGRAWLQAAQQVGDLAEQNTARLKAKDFLDRAVAGLRKAGTQHELPRALLARAQFFRWQKLYEKAWEDLSEAREIAETGNMDLHLCDYYLEGEKVLRAEGRKEEAEKYRKIAKKMVEEIGYYRRRSEHD
jgi:tetratricopeptide (TPR) repeat protein